MSAVNVPEVFIGMPAYNGEKFIAKAIYSLIHQSFQNFRLVIADDQSTDGTREIAEAFAARDSRVEYQLNPERLGGARNFSQLARMADTPYFMWAAQDDMWHPEYIEKCLAHLQERPQASVCVTNLFFTDAEDTKTGGLDNMATEGQDIRTAIQTFISYGMWYALYGLMRTEALQQTHLYTNRYGGDVLLQLELLLQGEIAKVPEMMFAYRKGDEFKTPQQNMYAIDHTIADVPRKYYTELFQDLFGIVMHSSLSPELKQAVYRDFLEVLQDSGKTWRERIWEENCADFAAAVLNQRDIAAAANAPDFMNPFSR